MRRKESLQFQPDLVAPRDAAQGQAFTSMAVLQDDIWTTVLRQRVLRLVKMPNAQAHLPRRGETVNSETLLATAVRCRGWFGAPHGLHTSFVQPPKRLDRNSVLVSSRYR